MTVSTSPMARDASRSAPSRWNVVDTVAMWSIVGLAGFLRFWRVEEPRFKIFDEIYYTAEACNFVTEGPLICLVDLWTPHPPAGKWLIASGIWWFGPTPLGARFAPALVGTLTVLVLFLLGRRVLGSTLGAYLAAGLLAVDFLHLVTSRVATLDVFASFFLLSGLLAWVYDRDERRRGPRVSPASTAQRPLWARDIHWSALSSRWLVIAGACLGLAVASKWTTAPVLLALLGFAVWEAVHRDGRGFPGSLRAAFAGSEGRPLIALGLVPVVIYALTYIGRLDGAFLVAPWAEGAWARQLIAEQMAMAEYHLGIRRAFVGEFSPRYASPPWSWPLLQRPIAYAFAVRGGLYREVLATGNPLVWWPGICAVVACAVGARSAAWKGATLRVVLAVGFGGTYLTWLFVSPVVNNVFLYYFVGTVPFLCVALAALMVRFIRSRLRALAVAAYVTLVVAAFVFYFPVLTWRALGPADWERRMLFSSCEAAPVAGDEIVIGSLYELDNPFMRPVLAFPKEAFDPGDPLPPLTRADGWCWR